MLTVICPVYNEEKYIVECMESILRQDYPKDDLEVIFVDGMSTDGTRAMVDGYARQYPFIHLLDNPRRIVPTALNTAIRAAKGDLIARIDAHAKYPDNYLSLLARKLQTLEADNVGGVCRTLPAKDTPLCQAIAAALSSPFGMGNSYFRIGADHDRQVDTVPFGFFHRSLFDRIGMFDEELIRNQDDEFSGRIIREGGKIFLIPEVVIDYFARDTIGKVSRMFYQYGLFKPLVNRKLGKPATVRQFFPLAFVLALIVGAGLCFAHRLFRYLYIAMLGLYLLLALWFGKKLAKNWRVLLWMPLVFFVVHVSYGWGYLRGLLKLVAKRGFQAQANR